MTMKDVSFSFVVKEIFKVKHKKCRCSLRVAAFLILYLSVLSLRLLVDKNSNLSCLHSTAPPPATAFVRRCRRANGCARL